MEEGGTSPKKKKIDMITKHFGLKKEVTILPVFFVTVGEGRKNSSIATKRQKNCVGKGNNKKNLSVLRESTRKY